MTFKDVIILVIAVEFVLGLIIPIGACFVVGMGVGGC